MDTSILKNGQQSRKNSNPLHDTFQIDWTTLVEIFHDMWSQIHISKSAIHEANDTWFDLLMILFFLFFIFFLGGECFLIPIKEYLS